MNTKEILSFCLERGMLIDKEVLNLFKDTNDVSSVKLVLEKIKESTQQIIITKNVFNENKEKVLQFFSSLPEENQKKLEKLKINLGLSIEISRQSANLLAPHIKTGITNIEKNDPSNSLKDIEREDLHRVEILSSVSSLRRKIEVKDFSKHFSARFLEMKKLLQDRSELSNLISINKISGGRRAFSVVGMVYDKRLTKNKNYILEVEDLTGTIKVIVTQNKKDLFQKTEDLALDSVVGFRGFGEKEVLFANEVILPDAAILQRKKSPVEENVLFVSDIHIGSKNFMEENFMEFIDYLNGKIPNTPETENIKYLFVVGDLVAGVGVYPGQEKDLEIKDLEGQYSRVAEIFSKIKKDIKIIMLPGNHDCVRLMEPQPVLDERYAWPIYNLKNVILTTNPSLVNIGAKKNFSGFDVLAYHGFSFPYYLNNVPSLMTESASLSPDKIMAYLLKNRHLAPTHASVQASPYEKDDLIIRKVPDIFVSGHTHQGAISYYNNILVISTTCWEELMPYQEKMGFKSDFCKVPMFNLKTRNVKILDFFDEEESKD